MRRLPVWLVALVLASLAACSSHATGPLVPVQPSVLRPAPLSVRTIVVDRAETARRSRKHRRRARATFVIHVPRKRARRGRYVPKYVSASTASIAIAIDGGKPVVTNLTAGSPNCKASGSSLQCQISVKTTVGSHVFSLVTYDGRNATGNRLSANTDVPVTLLAGANPPVSVTLGGIAASVAMLVAGETGAIGSVSMYGDPGTATFDFALVPRDADGNDIVGSGVPAVTVTPPPSAPISLASPAPGSSLWTLTSQYAPTNPTTPATFTLTPVATPVPSSGGSAVASPVTFSIYQPWIYVTNLDSDPPNAVDVFDQSGQPIPNVSAGFSHVPEPTGIAYDPQNQWIYVASLGDDVCVYDVLGNLITVSGSWPNLGSPWGIAYAPTTQWLYVGNNTGGGILAYDADGEAQTPSGTFPDPGYVDGLAFDPNNAWIYSTDGVDETIDAYDTQGNRQMLSALPPYYATPAQPNGIAFDSANSLLYVAYGDGDGAAGVMSFTQAGAPQLYPTGFGGLTQPNGVAYDPYDGLIYVVDQSKNEVFSYDENGVAQNAGFSTGGSDAWGITVVP